MGSLTQYFYIKNRSENRKYVCKEGVQRIIIKWGREGLRKQYVCKEREVSKIFLSATPLYSFFFLIGLSTHNGIYRLSTPGQIDKHKV